MTRNTFSLVLAAALIAGAAAPAHAHDFGLGGDYYDAFVSGAGAITGDIGALLALGSIGFMISIWEVEGMPRVWPHLAIGAAIGLLASPLLPDEMPLLHLGTAMVCGLFAAAAFNLPRQVIGAICALAGLNSVLGTLGGHAFADVPLLAYLGVFFAVNTGVAMAAGLVTLARNCFPQGWMMISCRALSSWIVAIAMMVGAFTLKA